LITNADNICKSIERLGRELKKLQIAVKNKNGKQIEKLLESARRKRAEMIDYKLKKKDML
jgi:prephenate dehydrogenase